MFVCARAVAHGWVRAGRRATVQLSYKSVSDASCLTTPQLDMSFCYHTIMS